MTATAASAYDRLLEVLENVKHPNGNHDKATANCPAHDSASRSSLSVKRAEGKALVYCFGGCTTEAVLDKLGWGKADLYDDRRGYTYEYPDGAYAHRSYDNAGRKKFYQSGNTKGDSTKLYRLAAVEAAKLAGQDVWLVEGEDDVHALETLGVVATTTRGGVGMQGKADLTPLYGARVNVVVDKDKPGDKRAHYLRTMLQGKARTLTFFHAKTGKDAQDHIAADHGLDEFIPYEIPADEEPESRWLNLDEYLDGTYVEPTASVGGDRDDMIRMLYPGRWHTCIALTTAGKTWMALWHAKAVMEEGGHVVYIHFEEPQPGGTISRLIAMGCDKETIRKQFHWPDPQPWAPGEIERQIGLLPDIPALALLDGINAACGQQGWDVERNPSVGEYKRVFVTPLTTVGTTVFSLGHPVKDMRRQGESYSYGAAGWLNDPDGVAFRMESSKTPIERERKGSSALYTVKDRYGDVQRWGERQDKGEGTPWYYLGQFVVDSTPPTDTLQPASRIHVSVPAKNEEGKGKGRIDYLADAVKAYLKETTGRFETFTSLFNKLKAREVPVSKSDLPIALEKLVDRGELEWPEVTGNAKRPGWLTLREDDDS